MLDYDTDDPRGLLKEIRVGKLCTTDRQAAFSYDGSTPWLYVCLGYHSTGKVDLVHIMKLQHVSGEHHPEIGEAQWLPKSDVFRAPSALVEQFNVYKWRSYELPPKEGLWHKPTCKEDLGSPVKLGGVSKKVQLQFDAWQRAKTDRAGNVSSYILIWNDLVRAEYSGACHSDMSQLEDYTPDLVGKLKYIYTAVWDMSKEYEERNPRIAEACKAFQKYFFLHSPFAQYFKGQSLKGIFRDGLKLSPDLPSNLLLHIITWTRQPWEYPQYIVTWKELVDKGIRPDVAMVTCQLLGSPSTKSEIEESYDCDYYDTPIYSSPHDTNHSPFEGEHLTYQDVIGLCNQELNLCHEHYPYSEELSFDDVWRTFSVGHRGASAAIMIERWGSHWVKLKDQQDLTPLECEYPTEEVEEECDWSGDIEIVQKTRYGDALEALVEYSNEVIEYLGGEI